MLMLKPSPSCTPTWFSSPSSPAGKKFPLSCRWMETYKTLKPIVSVSDIYNIYINSCRDTHSTVCVLWQTNLGSFSNMCCVPLPWWTSQSSMSTLNKVWSNVKWVLTNCLYKVILAVLVLFKPTIPLYSKFVLSITSCNCNCVEETESHSSMMFSMMSRRPVTARMK